MLDIQHSTVGDFMSTAMQGIGILPYRTADLRNRDYSISWHSLLIHLNSIIIPLGACHRHIHMVVEYQRVGIGCRIPSRTRFINPEHLIMITPRRCGIGKNRSCSLIIIVAIVGSGHLGNQHLIHIQKFAPTINMIYIIIHGIINKKILVNTQILLGHLTQRSSRLTGILIQHQLCGSRCPIAINHIITTSVNHRHSIHGTIQIGSNTTHSGIVIRTLGSIVGKIDNSHLVIPINDKPRTIITGPITIMRHNPKIDIGHIDAMLTEIGIGRIHLIVIIHQHFHACNLRQLTYQINRNAKRIGDNDTLHGLEFGHC